MGLGFRFYYWPYYKDKDVLPAIEQKTLFETYHASFDNKHDHSGYKVCDLYIIRKYGSFQEEISNYDHFDIQKYNKAKTKTLKYLKTEEIKKLKVCKSNGFMKNKHLHYDIDKDGVI